MFYYNRFILKIILLPTVAYFLFFSSVLVHTAYALTVEEIVKLKEAGISDEIILEMIKAEDDTGDSKSSLNYNEIDTENYSSGTMQSEVDSDFPFVCPYGPGEHLASWVIGGVAGDLGSRFGSRAGSEIGSQFGLAGMLIGSVLGSAAGEKTARSLVNDMIKASHLPPFSGSMEVFQHMAESHIENPEVGKGVRALVDVYGLDKIVVSSVSDSLYRKAFR